MMTYFSRRWVKLLALSLAWPWAGAFAPVGAATVFSSISSPYSWVGQGEATSATPDDGFSFSVNPYHLAPNSTDEGRPLAGISFWINNFSTYTEHNPAKWWGFSFFPGVDQTLTVGSYSTDSPINDFDSMPGAAWLDFYGNGRGTNLSSGLFKILELSLADDGTPLTFAADFVHYEEGWKSLWNKGSIRYNSDLPISLAPEPIDDRELIWLGYLPDPDILIFPQPLPDELAPLPAELEGGDVKPIEITLTIDEGDIPVDDMITIDRVIFESSGSSMSTTSWQPYDLIALPASPANVPGPLPAAAVLAGWHASRRLRRRCKSPGA